MAIATKAVRTASDKTKGTKTPTTGAKAVMNALTFSKYSIKAPFSGYVIFEFYRRKGVVSRSSGF